MIYFDNAATTGKKPEAVINAVKYSLMGLSANPGRSGHALSVKASELVYDTRNIVCDYFNSGAPENVVFTQNCTQSINIVLKGTIERGDNVLISDMEHNAVMRPLTAMHTDFTEVEVSLYDDAETVRNFESAIKDNTKMIFVTAASNVTGKALPLKEIGAIAKKHGLLFGVDAAQGAGVSEIDIKNMNIDFLCIAPHKGLYAPMGTGILIADKPILKTILEGGTGSESVNLKQPEGMPERLESGTVNLPGISGIKAGINFVRNLGGKIYDEEISLVQKLYELLAVTEGAVLYTPYPEKNIYMPVLSFNVEDVDSAIVADELNKHGIAVRAGLHCAPEAHRKIGTLNTGTVRISPSVYNTKAEIGFLAKIIKKICENRKKYVD